MDIGLGEQGKFDFIAEDEREAMNLGEVEHIFVSFPKASGWPYSVRSGETNQLVRPSGFPLHASND